MKVGFSPHHNHYITELENEKVLNITLYNPSPAEGIILFTFAILGALGNIFVMMVTMMHPRFRQMSSAFLFHHCLLDAIKSLFCLSFGYSLLMNKLIPHCDVLGAAYMLLMTVSAYNLLALLLNEEYQCSYLSKRPKETQGDTCCIIFGLVMIWFTTVLLHLGVAFLPGSSEFSRDIGNCVYRYGITKNYVIHVLWVLLVTGAVIVATFSFFHFYKKLSSSIQCRKWSSLHKSLSFLNTHHNKNHNHHYHHHHHHPLTMSQDDDEEDGDQRQMSSYRFEDDSHFHDISLQISNSIRRIVILFCMLISFVICWYPLFLLTLLDVHYKQPAHLYRILTMVAWVHPLTTPIFCSILYYKRVWTGPFRDIYTNAIPMTQSKSSYSYSHSSGHNIHHQLEQDEEVGVREREMGETEDITTTNTDSILSFHNHNFHWGGDSVASGAIGGSGGNAVNGNRGCGGGGGGGGGGENYNMEHNHVVANNISSTSSLLHHHPHHGNKKVQSQGRMGEEEEAGQTLIM